ncbi:MAG TPA: type II secretion system protein [Anaerohalosphaeraceae bacterium]|nr:type II secretion system protein [Anaerohalosphaeraceae bacterium]
MKKHKPARASKGFTLIEAMMAMVILAVAASGIVVSFAAAASVQTEAQRRIIASRLAADKIEHLASLDFAVLESVYVGKTVTESAGTLTDSTGSLITGNAYAGLSRTVSCEYAAVAGVKLIWMTVDVTYHGTPAAHLSTLIGDKYKH